MLFYATGLMMSGHFVEGPSALDGLITEAVDHLAYLAHDRQSV